MNLVDTSDIVIVIQIIGYKGGGQHMFGFDEIVEYRNWLEIPEYLQSKVTWRLQGFRVKDKVRPKGKIYSRRKEKWIYLYPITDCSLAGEEIEKEQQDVAQQLAQWVDDGAVIVNMALTNYDGLAEVVELAVLSVADESLLLHSFY